MDLWQYYGVNGFRHTHVIITVDKTGIKSSFYLFISSTIKYYKLISKSFTDKLLFLLYSKIFLELPLVLLFLLLQLLLEMRMTKHIVLTKSIYLEIRIILCDLESLINNCLFCFHFLWHLLVYKLLHFLLPPLKHIDLVKFILQFIVKFEMHQVPMHIFL